MRDQAENLRVQIEKSRTVTELSVKGVNHAKTLAVVSGKGGVGKSNFSLNFSIILAKQGKRVLLFDMDIGMGNINILLGNSTQKTIVDYFHNQASFEEIVVPVSEQLSYVGGGSGLASLFTMDDMQFTRFLKEFSVVQAEYDYIIFDLGAGISKELADFLACVDEIITITTPEPTSLMDAYSMIKYIHFMNEKLPVYVICNRTLKEKQGVETINRLQETLKRFLGKEIISLGSLPDSKVVLKAVTSQTPFSLSHPKADITLALQHLATNYLLKSFNNDQVKTKKTFLDKLQKFFIGR